MYNESGAGQRDEANRVRQDCLPLDVLWASAAQPLVPVFSQRRVALDDDSFGDSAARCEARRYRSRLLLTVLHPSPCEQLSSPRRGVPSCCRVLITHVLCKGDCGFLLELMSCVNSLT